MFLKFRLFIVLNEYKIINHFLKNLGCIIALSASTCKNTLKLLKVEKNIKNKSLCFFKSSYIKILGYYMVEVEQGLSVLSF